MAMELYSEAYQLSVAQVEALKQPLLAARIKERKGGGGKMLKYLKADDVIGVANDIFGYGQWGYKVLARGSDVVDDPKKGKMQIYTADIELSVVGCPFTFPGDGVGIVNDPYTVEMHEKARKEATSDALKRALRHFGDQFGLCLYDQEDMVDAGDGTMIQVREVKPGAKQSPPKRVIEEKKPALDPVTKERLNNLYPRAKALSLFPLGKNDAECVAAFLAWVSELVRVRIAGPQDLTKECLDIVEERVAHAEVAPQTA